MGLSVQMSNNRSSLIKTVTAWKPLQWFSYCSVRELIKKIKEKKKQNEERSRLQYSQ